jgi:hypothetical protein
MEHISSAIVALNNVEVIVDLKVCTWKVPWVRIQLRTWMFGVCVCVCVCAFFCVSVVLCVGRGLATV